MKKESLIFSPKYERKCLYFVTYIIQKSVSVNEREFCLKLLKSETEEEVVDILKKYDYWDDRSIIFGGSTLNAGSGKGIFWNKRWTRAESQLYTNQNPSKFCPFLAASFSYLAPGKACLPAALLLIIL
ncbi:MAG: hypothetical protein WCA79_20110 [Anaerolineales bacterium]